MVGGRAPGVGAVVGACSAAAPVFETPERKRRK